MLARLSGQPVQILLWLQALKAVTKARGPHWPALAQGYGEAAAPCQETRTFPRTWTYARVVLAGAGPGLAAKPARLFRRAPPAR